MTKKIENAALTAAAAAVKAETKSIGKAEKALKAAAALTAKAEKATKKGEALAAEKAETKAAERAAAQALKDAAAEAAESIEAAALAAEISKLIEARRHSAGQYTKLVRRIVVNSYARQSVELIDGLLAAVKSSRLMPTAKTIAVLKGICHIDVVKGEDKEYHAAALPTLSKEQYNEMVLRLSDRGFLVDTYSAPKAQGEDGEKSDPYAEMDGIATAALAAALRKAEKELERLQALSPKGEQAQAANAERIKRVKSAIDFTKVLGNEIPRLVKAMRLA
jgi:hypothetical protein